MTESESAGVREHMKMQVNNPTAEEFSSEHVKIGADSAADLTELKGYREPGPSPVLDVHELRTWSIWRAAIAEFMATLILVFIGVSTAVGNHRDSPSGVGQLGIAWSFGATVFILVYCIAGISGGHINPAVTLGLFLGRRMSLFRALIYMVAQTAGGVCGAGVARGLHGYEFEAAGGGANVLSRGISTGVGLGIEIVGTFILVYVVYSATDAKRNAQDSHVPVLAPLPIGLAVFVLNLGMIPITGCSVKPARSFGPAAIYNGHKVWDDQWIFWVGPFLGAAAAAFYHQFVLRGCRSHFVVSSAALTQKI
ncbi:hypothetical protein R1flu_013773 [Riccia fluitans]|uniref:Uncharacterized protein n=1 Tax=Riccia fluitans TaxID=41844 RepID=A0ABD1YEC7_9MARC